MSLAHRALPVPRCQLREPARICVTTRQLPNARCQVERLPWAEAGSWLIRPFEDRGGYLAQRCDKTTVNSKMPVVGTETQCGTFLFPESLRRVPAVTSWL
jgi:hypothetical protein